jgi:hypothetical protein
MICNEAPESRIGGFIYLQSNSMACAAVAFHGQGGNPSIQFVGGDIPSSVISIEDSEVIAIDIRFFRGRIPGVQELLVTQNLSDTNCSRLGETGVFSEIVFATYQRSYWIHDPRFVSDQP